MKRQELFVSLQLLEQMRMEIIQKLILEAQSSNEEAFSNMPLNNARNEALKRIGTYELLHVKDRVVSRSDALEAVSTDESEYLVHHLAYYGMLPPYREGFHSLIRQYYHTLTPNLEHLHSKALHIKGKAVMIILHYFNNSIIRDLDNRNRKYIIDAVRNTPLLTDDSWQNLAIYEEGFEDNENHVQVYLLDIKHKNTFMSILTNQHNQLKVIPSISDISITITDSSSSPNEENVFEINPIIKDK